MKGNQIVHASHNIIFDINSMYNTFSNNNGVAQILAMCQNSNTLPRSTPLTSHQQGQSISMKRNWPDLRYLNLGGGSI